MIAAIRDSADIQWLVGLILAVLAFGVAIYLAYLSRWIPALVAAVIGLVICFALL